MTPVYRDYTQSQLDAQYDQATNVPDLSPYLDFWAETSATARRTLNCRTDIRYGRGRAERLDIFLPEGEPPAGGWPVHLYYHGGSWKLLDKSFGAIGARPVVDSGAIYIAVGFALATVVPLKTMVRQARSALAWAWRNIGDYRGSRDRITVSGHSSGGHLVGCLIASGWHGRFRLPQDVIKGATAACGLYDLEPVRLSARQDYLDLSDEDVETLSPIRHIPGESPPDLALFWGDGDLEEFRRQSRDFAAAWASAGHPLCAEELPHYNHFDVSNVFADADGPIGTAIRRQISDTRRR